MATDPWDDYRARRSVALIALGGFVPVGYGAGELLSRLVGTAWPTLVWFAAWAPFTIWACARSLEFPCPWCRKYFYVRGSLPVVGPFARRCRNCGLPKWADPGE